MEVTTDNQAKAVYIKISCIDGRGKVRTIPVNKDILVDVLEDGTLYGIEVLDPGLVDYNGLKDISSKTIGQFLKELDAATKEVDRKNKAVTKLQKETADIQDDIASATKNQQKYTTKKAAAEKEMEREVGKVGVGKMAISIGEKELQHVKDRHLRGGKEFKEGTTSYFKDDVDIVELIKAVSNKGDVTQSYGGKVTVTTDLGKKIGYDRDLDEMTSVMTVVMKESGELVTAYPGKP